MTPTAGAELAAEWTNSNSAELSSVRLIDLAIWYGREQNIADLEALLAWFKSEYGIDAADLVGTIYTDGTPDEYKVFPLSADPLTDEDYELLGSKPAAPSLPGTVENLVEMLEAHLDAVHFLSPPGLVDALSPPGCEATSLFWSGSLEQARRCSPRSSLMPSRRLSE